MLESITQNVITELQSNNRSAPKLIHNIILPHVDFIEMSRWIVGRHAWLDAKNATRELFIQEFQIFLVKNYTQLLLKFPYHKIKFLPLREAITTQKHIQVSSLVTRKGTAPVNLNYHLILEAGTWKVYDIVIEGISLLEGYQADFAEVIQHGGVAAAIEKIRSYNANH